MEHVTAKYDQALRKSSNDGRRHFFGSTKRLIAFVCECGSPACFETVSLSASEFDELRPGLLLAHGHEVVDGR